MFSFTAPGTGGLEDKRTVSRLQDKIQERLSKSTAKELVDYLTPLPSREHRKHNYLSPNLP